MEEAILKEREVRQQIVEIINNSGLPALILKPIFNDFLNQLNIIEQRQYNVAKEKKQKENENKPKEAKK